MAERVVFDTNIWISGLLWHGRPYQCLLLARSGIVQVVYCPPAVAELAQKLRHVFGFSENSIQAVLHDLRRFGYRVDVTGDLHIVSDDPDDDKFVECAVVSGARLIVSGDHHLLDLREFSGIRILSATEFLDRFTNESLSAPPHE